MNACRSDSVWSCPEAGIFVRWGCVVLVAGGCFTSVVGTKASERARQGRRVEFCDLDRDATSDALGRNCAVYLDENEGVLFVKGCWRLFDRLGGWGGKE